MSAMGIISACIAIVACVAAILTAFVALSAYSIPGADRHLLPPRAAWLISKDPPKVQFLYDGKLVTKSLRGPSCSGVAVGEQLRVSVEGIGDLLVTALCDRTDIRKIPLVRLGT